jgi:hypothetical protein
MLIGGSAEPLCIVAVGDDGSWACAVTGLESSPSTGLRVVQQLDGQEPLEAAVAVRVLTAPVVAGGPRGALTNGVVVGTAYPGASVTASTDGDSCAAAADASGAWTCPLEGVTDGPHPVSAVQATSFSDGIASPSSDAVTVQVDRGVPAAPVVSAPAQGARLPVSGALFAGSGESGATVSVFAGAQVLCEAVVADGSWSCRAGRIPEGRYRLAVLQQDAAGNVSVQSGPRTVQFERGGATTPPSSTPIPRPGTSSPDAATPSQPGDPGSPSAPGGGSYTDPGGDAPPKQGPAPGGAVGPGGSAGGTWLDATRFTTALQPVLSVTGNGLWMAAIAMAALTILLIALPGRLLTSAAASLGASSPGSVLRTTGSRLLGRNRAGAEFDRAPQVTVGPLARGALVVGAAAALVTLSGPVLGQPAYLRLAIAAAAGIVVVSVAGAVLPAVVARRVFGIAVEVRIRPALLLAVAGCALGSRLADLDPALVFGLVAAVTLGESAGRSARGLVSTLQALGLLTAGALAGLVALATSAGWATPAGGEGDGVWQAAASEFTTVTALGAIGAAAVLLVPVGRSAGRRMLDWSPATWLLTASAAFTALALVYVPALLEAARNGTLVVTVVAAAAFAAVGVSAWLWVRFLRPG